MSKEYVQTDKAVKNLGRDTVEEMDAMDDNELRKVIVEANSSMKQVADELEANKDYQALKEDLKAITQGKREVDKRQKARINYALLRLSALGKMDPAAYLDWRKQVAEYKEKKRKEEVRKAQEEAEALLQEGNELMDENGNA